jgi:uncharacterized protein (DUF4415 family)
MLGFVYSEVPEKELRSIMMDMRFLNCHVPSLHLKVGMYFFVLGRKMSCVHLYTGTMKQKYDFSKGKRGAVVPIPAGKTRVTIRLDSDVLDWFRDEVDKAGGGNYQSLINVALRDFVSRSKEPLEKTLRRVIREELRRAG